MCLFYTLENVYIVWYTMYSEKECLHGGASMPMKYDRLFVLMKEKGLTTYRIRKERIISEGTLQKLREGQAVSTESLAALCKALNCQPGDIMEYVEDKPTE